MPHRDGYAHGTPCWVDLSTDDLEGAQAFYSGLFGWSWDDQHGPDGEFIYSLAQLDGRNVAGLGPAPDEMVQAGVRAAWNTYLAVDSVDDAYQAAIDAGAAGVFGPCDVMDAGRMAYIMDDQGVPVGLWQAGRHKGAQVIHEPGALTWNELCVPDTDAAARFYGAVLGLDTEPAEMDIDMAYTLWKVGEDIVGGLMAPPMDEVPPYWNVYFGTADVEETAAAVPEFGGQIVNGPFPTPVGPMAVIQDPAGGPSWPSR